MLWSPFLHNVQDTVPPIEIMPLWSHQLLYHWLCDMYQGKPKDGLMFNVQRQPVLASSGAFLAQKPPLDTRAEIHKGDGKSDVGASTSSAYSKQKGCHGGQCSCCLLQWLHWIRGCGILCNMSPCDWGIYIRWQHHNFLLFALFSCIKKIVQSCRYVGLLGLSLQSNSSNCLVLILHGQLENFGIFLYF